MIEANDRAFLIAPDDLTKYHAKIGVRSLSDGATLTFDGHSFTYGPDSHDQRPADAFIGRALNSGEVIDVIVTSGRAIVYLVGVDNVTNDTSFQLANRLRY
ncbi:MAG TPA: hypothetical protein VG777_02465 [Thermoanaerobaculia bacterium]|nr:hypothetical protein [Thermoanaerobaculia bacterium]